MEKVEEAMRALMFGMLMISAVVGAAEYAAPDGSFKIRVPEGWRVRTAPIAGQTMTIVEPSNGGEERIVGGGGIAQPRTVQELSQQAAVLAAQLMQGAQLAGAPRFGEQGGVPMAEQEYRSWQLDGWHGMVLRGEVYFGVLALGRTGRMEVLRQKGREMLGSSVYAGPARDARAEQALQGRWVYSDNRTTKTGVRDSLMYMSNWTVTFLPGNRFQSFKESFVDTTSEVYGGGNVGAANRHLGTYRVFGGLLVADIEGAGRQIFSLEFYPNGAGVKLNGQLFLRP
jgi:hypothetical protein